uniref:Aquaporin n=1 Tax=Picocystis salinarum TaxID=88271 RepID=A0A6U9R0N9_9CHLO|mmetsp:Transcript_5595/g.34712  ORF Transcript_5595/g.34712 Transcript_5595/m.34712 type:complete len:369 (-) Transcript_5595:1125-2231(-)
MATSSDEPPRVFGKASSKQVEEEPEGTQDVPPARPSFVQDVRAHQLECGFCWAGIGPSLSFGLDLSPHEICNPLFWRAVLAEFFATGMLVYFIILTTVFRADNLVQINAESVLFPTTSATQTMLGIVYGFSVFVVVFWTAGISGGHVNPAVTAAVTITKKITVVRGVCYVIAQLGGAVCGSLIVKSLRTDVFNDVNGGANELSDGYGWQEGLVAELMATALWTATVLACLDSERVKAVLHLDALGAFAVGMAALVGYIATVPVDGASLNPARSFGPAVASTTWSDHWVFWAGPMAGSLAAAVIYEVLFRGRKQCEQRYEPGLISPVARTTSAPPTSEEQPRRPCCGLSSCCRRKNDSDDEESSQNESE